VRGMAICLLINGKCLFYMGLGLVNQLESPIRVGLCSKRNQILCIQALGKTLFGRELNSGRGQDDKVRMTWTGKPNTE